MELLNKQALINARDMVCKKFFEPSSLDDLNTQIFLLEKQLVASETQLNNVVQGKLDSLKRAADLMDESSIKLSKMSSSIQKVDNKIHQTNTSISNFEYLKRVHHVKSNLEKVINQVEFFARVPEKVQELRSMLEDQEDGQSNLKEVYLESLKLNSLKIALVKEIESSNQFKKMATQSSNPSNLRSRGQEAGNDPSRRMREAVENHLRIVSELVAEVRGIVLGNIDRMWELAVHKPEYLVASFEIVEMQQQYNERRVLQTEKKMAQGIATNPTQINNYKNDDGYENIYLQINAKIMGTFSELVEKEFETVTGINDDEENDDDDNGQNHKKVSHVTQTLVAANRILQKMYDFKEDVLPCIPPKYEALFLFINIFDEQMLPKIDNIMLDVSTLQVSEILDFINWIEYHKECMESFGLPSRESIVTFSNVKQELVTEYKSRIKTQVNQWFENIQNQQLEIVQSANKTLVTSNPEDMFNIIHVQLEVAREKLPAEYSNEVAITCLQVLQDVQRKSYDTLNQDWNNMNLEKMCATINDNLRMHNKMNEFHSHLIQYIEDGEEKKTLINILEAVSKEYLILAQKTVQFLAKCLLDELKEPFFLRLYGPEWEAGENLSSILVVTLGDYFSDLMIWLSEEFFCSLVKEILQLTIAHYVMNLRRKGNGTFQFINNDMVSNRIFNDKVSIEKFFEQYVDQLVKAGLERVPQNRKSISVRSSFSMTSSISPVGMELSILENLLKLLNTRSVTGLENDVKIFCQQFGMDGLKVAILAVELNPWISPADKLIYKDHANKMFNEGGDKYIRKCKEEFLEYDPVMNHAGTTGQKDSTTEKRSFWGRKKRLRVII